MQQAERIAMTADAWLPIYYYVSKALLSQKVQGYVDNTKHTHRSRWVSIKGWRGDVAAPDCVGSPSACRRC